jgi:hypothetical protein
MRGWKQLRGLGLLAAVMLVPVVGEAAPPVVTGVNVRGFRTGGATAITVTGGDLLPNPRFVSTGAIARQRVLEGAVAGKVTIEVELASDARAGLENVWVVTDGGVSSRLVFAVDGFLQQPVEAKVETLPVSVHGNLSGAQVAESRFVGKQGQELLLEVEAQRMDSKLRPVLRLFGPDGVLVAWSGPMSGLRGDTRLGVRIPKDGEYRVELRDLQYAATAPAHFRMKIGEWVPVDSVFPAMVQAGVSAEVEAVSLKGPVGKMEVKAAATGRAVPTGWPRGLSATGSGALVWLSPLKQAVENRKGDEVQALEGLPVSVNGRIGAAWEVDRYLVPVEPESEVEVGLLADALGSPLDGEVELTDEKGARLAVNDDVATGPDARLTFKVPKGVTRLIAAVRDVSGNAGPAHVYCLQVMPKAAQPSAGGYRLRLVEDALNIPTGGVGVVRVEALREGYDGPIAVKAAGLPGGYRLEGTEIPAEASGTLISIRREKEATPAVVSFLGEREGKSLAARVEAVPGGRLPPWLEEAFVVAESAADESGFRAEWADDVSAKRMPLSGKALLKVKCVRPVGHDGPVRLTLLTSQARQLDAKGAVQAMKMLREEKAVLIEEDKKAQTAFDAIAAADKALKAAQAAVDAAAKKGEVGEPLSKALSDAQAKRALAQEEANKAAAAAKNEAEMVLLIPPDLVEVPHMVSLKAELLKRDRKTVESFTYLPVAKIPVVNPVVLKFPAEVAATVEPKKGGVLEIKGEIERTDDAKGDVTVSLSGLPAGLNAPAVTVKAADRAFAFKINLPAAFKPGEFPAVKVSATSKPFGQVQVKTRDFPLTLKVVAADDAAQKTSG